MDGILMDIHGMSFPGGGIQSYSAYGGLCARINIIQGENGAPRIEISDKWDGGYRGGKMSDKFAK